LHPRRNIPRYPNPWCWKAALGGRYMYSNGVVPYAFTIAWNLAKTCPL
jgi:hypothetical protein